MSRYPFPDLSTLPDDIRARILEVQEKAGFIPNVFLAFARRPAEWRAFFAYHDALMLKEEGSLTKGEREMIVTATSAANQCLYCVVAHGAILRIYEKKPLIADQVAVNWRKADISPLLTKLGIKVVTRKTAPRADAESLYRAFTDDERVELGKKVAQFYAVFLDRVARGRGWTIEKVDAVGHGKVWTGARAKDVDLVDVVGGFDAALADT